MSVSKPPPAEQVPAPTGTAVPALPAQPERRLRPLDGLRGLAVLAVVLFHLGFDAFPGGLLGVDVFFVLSGFLITALLLGEVTRTGRVDLRAFYVRRLLRLAPALVALVVVVGSRVVRAALARRRPGWRPVAVPVVPVVVTVLLGTGVYGMSQTIEGTDTGSLAERMDYFVSRASTDGVLPTTQDVVDGGR